MVSESKKVAFSEFGVGFSKFVQSKLNMTAANKQKYTTF